MVNWQVWLQWSDTIMNRYDSLEKVYTVVAWRNNLVVVLFTVMVRCSGSELIVFRGTFFTWPYDYFLEMRAVLVAGFWASGCSPQTHRTGRSIENGGRAIFNYENVSQGHPVLMENWYSTMTVFTLKSKSSPNSRFQKTTQSKRKKNLQTFSAAFSVRTVSRYVSTVQ